MPATILGSDTAVADARHLDLPDASVDAVLLLGPLYHLHERADRLRALCAGHGGSRAPARPDRLPVRGSVRRNIAKHARRLSRRQTRCQ